MGGGSGTWGKWENRRKKSKFGQKLHEIKIIKADFGMSKSIFPKIVVGGGDNKLKRLEKGNRKQPRYKYRSESTINLDRKFEFFDIRI